MTYEHKTKGEGENGSTVRYCSRMVEGTNLKEQQTNEIERHKTREQWRYLLCSRY